MLSDLEIGQKARIIKLHETDKVIRRHLLDMGITRGVEIKVKKIAPLGDPIDIALRDYELCISKKDLTKIANPGRIIKIDMINNKEILSNVGIF